MKKNIIIVLGEPNSISSEIFLKSINYIKNTKLNFIIIGNYSLLKKQANYLNFKKNVNLTEVNKELEKEQNNSVDDEKLKRQLIITEQNKLLNKYSATHLEKSKKKYLIKFL